MTFTGQIAAQDAAPCTPATHTFTELVKSLGPASFVARCSRCGAEDVIDLDKTANPHPTTKGHPTMTRKPNGSTPAAGDNGPPEIDNAEVAQILRTIEAKKKARSAVGSEITAERKKLRAMGFTTAALSRAEADLRKTAEERAEDDAFHAQLRRAIGFPIDADGQTGMFGADGQVGGTGAGGTTNGAHAAAAAG